MTKGEAKDLIVKTLQYYLDSAQEFLFYDEMMELKIELEDTCEVLDIIQ